MNLNIHVRKSIIVWFLLVGLKLIGQHKEPVFIYDDLRNFKEAFLSIQTGADPEEAYTVYFNKATPGFKAWIDRYGLTPKQFAERTQKRPNFFEALLDIEKRLKKVEPVISKGYKDLLSMYPDPFMPALPTYYFITDLGGGGSAEPLGVLIGADYFGLNEEIDLREFPEGIAPKGKISLTTFETLPQVAVHELAHWLQQAMQGKDGYEKMYFDASKSTVLAYAIREGGADMIARLGSGLEDKVKSEFGRAHEQELWEAIKPYLLFHVDDAKGWFSGRFDDHREWPFQIGYYVGMEITQYYYDQAENKEAALMEIFRANTNDAFIKFIQVYEKKFEE